MLSKVITISALSALILALAIFYKLNSDNVLAERLRNVLHGLLNAEEKLSKPQEHSGDKVDNEQTNKRTKIGVGFGGCFDAFLPAIEAFNLMNLESTNERTHHDVVNSRADFEQLFNYFFHYGAASE